MRPIQSHPNRSTSPSGLLSWCLVKGCAPAFLYPITACYLNLEPVPFTEDQNLNIKGLSSYLTVQVPTRVDDILQRQRLSMKLCPWNGTFELSSAGIKTQTCWKSVVTVFQQTAIYPHKHHKQRLIYLLKTSKGTILKALRSCSNFSHFWLPQYLSFTRPANNYQLSTRLEISFPLFHNFSHIHWHFSLPLCLFSSS